MKKSLPFLLFFFILINHVNAQIQVGPKAGINWNSFRGNHANYVTPGLAIGAFGKYTVLPFLTAKAELVYFQQGASLENYTVLPGDLYHKDPKVVFHNLQLPVIAEFGLPSMAEASVQPKISVGGFYSYNLYSRESYTNVATISGYDRMEYDGHDNATGQYSRIQFGLIGAVGADVTILDMPVYLEFRYTHNLSTITKAGTTTRYNLKNTYNEWGTDQLKLGTLSFNVAVTLKTF